MQPVVVHPDAEKAVIEYLAPALAAYDPTIPIDVRGAGSRYVRVRRIGGTDLDVAHDAPVLDVLVWHDSDRQRMELAQLLWATLRACSGDTTTDAVLVYLDTVLGPRQIPDPADETKTVAMFTVTLISRSR